MNPLKLQSRVWAMVIVLAMLWPSGLRWAQGQDNSPQNTQQSPDKKKKDKSSADNSKPNDPKSDGAAKSEDQPVPLFGGTLAVKSSRQTKDSATLGFNGVDDNGQVQKSFLAATAGGSDTSAVQRMSRGSINTAELNEFIQQGGLNANAPAKKSSNPGGKP
jgi:cytoskeletal protein RodZ